MVINFATSVKNPLDLGLRVRRKFYVEPVAFLPRNPDGSAAKLGSILLTDGSVSVLALVWPFSQF